MALGTVSRSVRKQTEEEDVQTTRRLMAIIVLAAAAMTQSIPSWAASKADVKLAMPRGQEETIYRPDCPSDESSTGGTGCRFAGPSGG